MTIKELGQKFRSGELSPVEWTTQTLQRIERLQPKLNAYITVTAEHALAQARQAETELRAGKDRGPLHGIPYAAKDLFYTKGILTTVGSKILGDFVPDFDATLIEKLTASGAVLIGKAGLHEWAYGITSDNPHFGSIRNPWDPTRIPGGSSGGSASALAAGMCSFSLGSDTGGSIRIPASLCGLAGLKGTFGRVSRHGVFPLGHTLDHAGPFGLTVEDAYNAYAAMRGGDANDDSCVERPFRQAVFATEPSLKGIKIGVPRNFYFEALEPDVESAVRKALDVLAGLGAAMVEITVPDINEANAVARVILLAEAASVHRRRLRDRPEDLGADVRALFEQGAMVTAADYLDAQRWRRGFNAAFSRLLGEVDVIATPTIPIIAAKIGQMDVEIGGETHNVRLATTRFMRALNLTGLPLLSVPCGFSQSNMPIGLQLIGRVWEEEALCEVGHAYERATDWHSRKPPLDSD
jgi:aspartyl-tRNA(Asn)/glutamyl-tRNA(Gln) amidotransferase subunit A